MTHALSCLSETEIAACDGGPGMYGEWTNWSVGSQECPGGISRRFQYYDCGSEPINDWQSLKSELVAQINSLTGHFGQNAVQPVPEPDPDNKLISVAVNQSLKPKNAALAHNPKYAVAQVTTVCGLPGGNAMTAMAISFFAEAVFDDEIELESVKVTMKMLNETHNDAVTIAHEPLGQIVQRHVVSIFKNKPSMIVTFKLIEKSALILL